MKNKYVFLSIAFLIFSVLISVNVSALCSSPTGSQGQYLCEGEDTFGYSVLECDGNNWGGGFNCISGYVCDEGSVSSSNPCTEDVQCNNNNFCEVGENVNNCPGDCVNPIDVCSNPFGGEGQYLCEGEDNAGYSVLQCSNGQWGNGFNCISGYVCTEDSVSNSNPCVESSACDNDLRCETGENINNCPTDCVPQACEDKGGDTCFNINAECRGGNFDSEVPNCCIGGECKLPDTPGNKCESCTNWLWGKISSKTSNQCNEDVVFGSDSWIAGLFNLQIKQGTWCPFYLISIGSIILVVIILILSIVLTVKKIKGRKRK